MALPDKPINRLEQFYNAIATGDPSGLPDPITREEAYLDYIAKNGGGGGGGGTTNYNALSNKPQINGATLSGNKSASDLNLVEAESGKGLSSNDYTDADVEKLTGLENITSVGTGLVLDDGNLSTEITESQWTQLQTIFS